jgi:hypothetical protein
MPGAASHPALLFDQLASAAGRSANLVSEGDDAEQCHHST